MNRQFPPHFLFGTSTAAAQIETADGHDWQGVVARDGHRFDRTTDHELRHAEDARIIAELAPAYRMGLSWSRLQRGPGQPLDPTVTAEYRHLLEDLRRRNVSIMMVLHHFANPQWFNALGGWEKKENISLFVDFGKQVVDTFGDYVSH